MPIYDYECKICGKEAETFRKIANRSNGDICCGEPMTIILSACAVLADNTCYKSQIDGTMITSRTQHKNHLKNNNCIEVGNEKPSIKDFARSTKDKQALRAEISAKLDAAKRS